MATQETIIDRLVVKNPSYGANFSIFIFGPLLAGKWAWSPPTSLMTWGAQTKNRPKSKNWPKP